MFSNITHLLQKGINVSENELNLLFPLSPIFVVVVSVFC